MSLPSRRALASRVAAFAVAACALFAAPAAALTLVPPKPNVFFGVSDRGNDGEFNEFTALLGGKHPALLETFHPWGNSLNKAYERWRETGTRPILHISTIDDQTLRELITPQQIALGAGDDYLLQLNDFFATNGVLAYLRPLGEPNRCLNAWSAVNCDGSQKGGEHTTGWYKQAFRRIIAIVRGGNTLERINATLAEIGLPPVNRSKGPPPESLPAAPIATIWSPLPGRLAAGQGQLPRQLLARRPLGRLGRHRLLLPVSRLERPQSLLRGKQWKRKPIAIAEWAVYGEDEPRFVKQLVSWVTKHQRVRMFVYYTGFGPGYNPYDLKLYPRTANTLRLKVRRASFLTETEYNVGTLPPLPPKPKKAAKSERGPAVAGPLAKPLAC